MSARLQHQIGDFIGPGQQQYKVLKRLASGGMGTVYKVENTLTGNIYAVKECDVLDDLSGKDLTRAQALDVFLAEGREVERLSHEGIPKGFLLAHDGVNHKGCMNCGTLLPPEALICPHQPMDQEASHQLQAIQRRLYLFMEFIDGPDAAKASAQMAKPLGREDLETVTGWIVQVAETLGFLHSKGLIHRDVKPENIKIAKERTYLLDFGLVAEAPKDNKTRRLDAPTAFHGTKGYAAPEQVQGHPRAATDSFALAMTFLAIATGEDPGQSETALLFLERDPAELAPEISASVAAVLRQALQKNPHARPTMAAWVTALSEQSTAAVHFPTPLQTKPLRAPAKSFRRPKVPSMLRPGSTPKPLKPKAGNWPKLLALGLNLRYAKWGAFALLVLITLWMLIPGQTSRSFQAEALPGAVIYKSMVDLRDGRMLQGGEQLKVRHVVGAEEGNWVQVLSLNGKKSNGYLLRSKVFRSRS